MSEQQEPRRPPNYNRLKLRVKARSLAEETRIINGYIRSLKRMGEKTLHAKAKRSSALSVTAKESMRQHKLMLRKEARSTCLALGFMRGRTHDQMEPVRYTEPNWEEVQRLCKKYGPPDWNGPPMPEEDEEAT